MCVCVRVCVLYGGLLLRGCLPLQMNYLQLSIRSLKEMSNAILREESPKNPTILCTGDFNLKIANDFCLIPLQSLSDGEMNCIILVQILS